MNSLRSTLKEHRCFVVVVTLLTLAMTFPTVVYVFKTDAFYLPTGVSYDVFIHIWDVWYLQQILSGAADRYFTTLLFYPEGLSLVHHPFSSMPINLLQIALQSFMPVSNAFSVAFLLVIFLNALAAYVYANWLFADKWIALFAAVVFGLSPHVVGQPNQLHDATIASVALAVYFFHRGVVERRSRLIIAAGLMAGLTSTITLYSFTCLLITLAAGVVAFAVNRWRDLRYWQDIGLLALVIAATSAWTIYPMVANSETLDAALEWHQKEGWNDFISGFVNDRHPLYGQALLSALMTPDTANLSTTSYVGFLPLALLCIGLGSNATRRKMLPWLVLAAAFFVLRLGSTLTINGVTYPGILLPKYYLNELMPFVFKAFTAANRFQVGLLLPLGVLACYGIVALRAKWPDLLSPRVILLLIGLLAFEYYAPPVEKSFSHDRFAYIAWLEQEEEVDIRLIHLPMGRIVSKQYMLFQSLSGYPHSEGAISRTPDSAFDYIRANPVTKIWHEQRPTNCVIQVREEYLEGLTQLIEDGFSHVLVHHGFYHWEKVIESFRYVDPAFNDDYVSIYRLTDLLASCPEDFAESHPFTEAYVEALNSASVVDERRGTIVIFPPSLAAGDHFLEYVRRFGRISMPVLAIATDEQGNIVIRSSESEATETDNALEMESALWLLNHRREYRPEQTEAFQNWFSARYKVCQRRHGDELALIDLYLESDIPCSALDASSALEIRYDGGLLLHNLSYDVKDAVVRFYLSWTNPSEDTYAYSLQFFAEDGRKVLQHDEVIARDLLNVAALDTGPLSFGANSVKLIVYDFNTGISQGGAIISTGERFERELEVAAINRQG